MALLSDSARAQLIDAHSAAHFSVLGVRVDAVQIPAAVDHLQKCVERGQPGRYVAVTGMHGVMEAQQDSQFRAVLNEAELVVPDGMPLVWLGRWYGHQLRRRVYGPELMMTFLQQTGSQYRHFFYGGAPGVPEALRDALQKQIPRLQVCGLHSPPFRPLSEQEEQKTATMINAAAPHVVWVGLSTPKQERWMHRMRTLLRAPVMIGVGAAFDVHSGRTKQAPRWMQENGLEWLYRLASEPRRLWRRYLVLGPQFVFMVGREVLFRNARARD